MESMYSATIKKLETAKKLKLITVYKVVEADNDLGKNDVWRTRVLVPNLEIQDLALIEAYWYFEGLLDGVSSCKY